MSYCKKTTVQFWANLILMLAFFGLGMQEAKATHAMGADFFYECIGPRQYRLTLNTYRDCNGVNLGNTACINYRSVGCGTVTNTNLTLNQVGAAVDITPLCVS